jgi:hypothetical protein
VPAAARHVRRFDPRARFEMPSLMTSVRAELAEKVLASGVLPECDCRCPSCRRSASITDRLAHADEHNLACWMDLREEIAHSTPISAATVTAFGCKPPRNNWSSHAGQFLI